MNDTEVYHAIKHRKTSELFKDVVSNLDREKGVSVHRILQVKTLAYGYLKLTEKGNMPDETVEEWKERDHASCVSFIAKLAELANKYQIICYH